MKTILLIDDDKQVRTMFGMALRRHGYRVIEADSGVAGLALAQQQLPDLILSDIHMPGGDGATLLQAIRKDPALRTKQVVLMTGRPDLVTPRKGMEDGADDFLVKPIDLKALLSSVQARFSRASINWRVEDETLAQLRSSVPSQLPHEFFTPLAGIIGLMEILRSGEDELDPKEVKDIHEDIYQSALRLHHTLRNYLLILDFHTPTPEQVIPILPPDEVKENILTGINDALRLNKRREDMAIQMNACPISVKAGDLTRMVEELVDNACKFSRQGTSVKVEFSAEGQLTVSDQGRGLTAEEISHIGAFHQFDRKKQEQQGLGLGLVLVQKIAAECKAEFAITSEPGKGTEVKVTFPTARAA